MNEQRKSAALLFLAALIWGVAFVAQSSGMEYIGPFTFTAVRSILGGLVLIPCVFLIRKIKGAGVRGKITKEETLEGYISEAGKRSIKDKILNKQVVLGGMATGAVLCVASNLQQTGIVYTTVGKAGFITALYIVMVPIAGLFVKKPLKPTMIFGVALAVLGFYFLCINGAVTINFGDILILLCAVAFTFQILMVDYYAPKVDGVVFSCIQFLTSGTLSLVPMFIFEEPKISSILACAGPILYAGVMSCGVAYTLQVIGQKGLNPTVATMIMSLESVISALAGWIILHESLSPKEIFGCVLVFAAVLIAQR